MGDLNINYKPPDFFPIAYHLQVISLHFVFISSFCHSKL